MEKLMKNQLQQGDVLFTKVNKLPNGCVKSNPKNGLFVIVEGETTGHRHVTTTEKTQLFELKHGDITDLYLEVTDVPTGVTHEEHKPIIFTELGIYKVGIKNEYDYLSQMQREVLD
jgi:hypothetical protein